ncbi:MAG: TIR domain-containing protein [Opitutus sp.]|nr:TIR domain-containing protein [Opitutus sp.]
MQLPSGRRPSPFSSSPPGAARTFGDGMASPALDTPTSPAAVFLSYAREDTAAVLRIAEALRSFDVEVWFDQSELRGGDVWDKKIRGQIIECSLFLPVISRQTQLRTKGYFRLEWKLAVEQTHLMAEGRPYLAPVVIDDTPESGAVVPSEFMSVQWIRLPGALPTPQFVEQIKRLLESPGESVLVAGTKRPPSAQPDGPPAPIRPSRETDGAWVKKRAPVQTLFLAGAVLVGVIFGWMAARTLSQKSEASSSATVTRLTIPIPASAPLASQSSFPWSGLNYPVLSPDGKVLLYVADVGKTTQLCLRPLDRFETRLVAGTEGAAQPFFSPDSQSIGFFADNKLKKISMQGGAAVTLGEARNPLSGTWSSEEIIYFTDDSSNLLRVPVGGGTPEILTNISGGLHNAPSGKQLYLYVSEGSINPDYNVVSLYSPSNKVWRPLDERGADPQVTSTGHLIILRGGAIVAAPFDVERQALRGPAVPVLEDRTLEGGIGAFSVSDNGTLVYVGGGSSGKCTPAWVDRAGKCEPLPMPVQRYGTFQLSPDGQRLAIVVAGATDDIWIYETATGKPARFTFEGNNTHPVWSPDGARVAFAAKIGGKWKLLLKPLAGGEAKELYANEAGTFPYAWSPDGRLLLFDEKDSRAIMALAVDGASKPEVIVKSKSAVWGASFSPDGRWIAYTAEESGRYEIYVQGFPAGPRVQVSFDGGEEPLWSRKGGELVYRNGNRWMSVSYTTNSEFKPETARELIKGPYVNVPGVSFGIAPDAARFLMLKPLYEEKPVTEVKVVLNWLEELKSKVPVGAKTK